MQFVCTSEFPKNRLHKLVLIGALIFLGNVLHVFMHRSARVTQRENGGGGGEKEVTLSVNVALKCGEASKRL